VLNSVLGWGRRRARGRSKMVSAVIEAINREKGKRGVGKFLSISLVTLFSY